MDFFAILDYIGQAIAALWSAVVDVINAVLQWVIDGLNFVWDSLVSFAQFLQGLFSSIRDILDDLYWTYLVPFVEWCQQVIDDITTWLADFLDPVITFVQGLIKWYNQYIYPILKIYIEVLQRVRAILAVFRALGFQWASKLDADLAKLQSYVAVAIQDVLGNLNMISNILGLIVDPAQVFRGTFFTNTLFSSLNSLQRASAFGGNPQLYASEAQSEIDDGNLLKGGASVATQNADGTVTLAPPMQSMWTNFDAALTYYQIPNTAP